MKKIVLNILLGIMLCSLISCASWRTRTIPSLSNDILPGHNETEIIIINDVVFFTEYDDLFPDQNFLLFVYINNNLVAQVDYQSSERIIVPNGEHKIKVYYKDHRQNHPKEIIFTANSERLTFRAIYTKVEVVDGVAVGLAAFGAIATLGLAAPYLIGTDFNLETPFLLLQQIE